MLFVVDKVIKLLEIRVFQSPYYKTIGHLQDLVIWYGIDYAGTQVTLWDLKIKGTHTSPARLSLF